MKLIATMKINTKMTLILLMTTVQMVVKTTIGMVATTSITVRRRRTMSLMVVFNIPNKLRAILMKMTVNPLFQLMPLIVLTKHITCLYCPMFPLIALHKLNP